MRVYNGYLAEEDWHMPIESSQYFIILFRVNQVFTFYHFIGYFLFSTFLVLATLWKYFVMVLAVSEYKISTNNSNT